MIFDPNLIGVMSGDLRGDLRGVNRISKTIHGGHRCEHTAIFITNKLFYYRQRKRTYINPDEWSTAYSRSFTTFATSKHS